MSFGALYVMVVVTSSYRARAFPITRFSPSDNSTCNTQGAHASTQYAHVGEFTCACANFPSDRRKRVANQRPDPSPWQHRCKVTTYLFEHGVEGPLRYERRVHVFVAVHVEAARTPPTGHRPRMRAREPRQRREQCARAEKLWRETRASASQPIRQQNEILSRLSFSAGHSDSSALLTQIQEHGYQSEPLTKQILVFCASW